MKTKTKPLPWLQNLGIRQQQNCQCQCPRVLLLVIMPLPVLLLWWILVLVAFALLVIIEKTRKIANQTMIPIARWPAVTSIYYFQLIEGAVVLFGSMRDTFFTVSGLLLHLVKNPLSCPGFSLKLHSRNLKSKRSEFRSFPFWISMAGVRDGLTKQN